MKKIDLTPPMKQHIEMLRILAANPIVEAAFNDAIAHVAPVLYNGEKNQWLGKDISYLIDYFKDWFTFLPTPTGGLGKIQPFTHFYINNKPAFYFLNQFKSRTHGVSERHTTEIFNWTLEFIKMRGEFMDSKISARHVEDWIALPDTKIDQFIMPKSGFQSFNDFFTRKLNYLKNPRPISEEDDFSILTATGDTEINFIQTDLTLATSLNVKTRQLNVNELLDSSIYAKHFVGGTAMSCVLMPTSYHHYHSPVSGRIVESKEVPGLYNGVMDGEHWFNDGNIGESTTDFSIFEDFHRAYYIIRTRDFGYVAVIPVGLNTISTIKFSSLITDESTLVPPGSPAVKIKKGDELGHFAYGGSLNILLFQKDVFSAISVLMGQRIGKLNNPNLFDLPLGQTKEGAWTSESMFSREFKKHYAQYYTFFLKRNTRINVNLSSDAAKPILIVRKGYGVDKTIIWQNKPKDDTAIFNDYMEEGYYTLEVTNDQVKTNGMFSINLIRSRD